MYDEDILDFSKHFKQHSSHEHVGVCGTKKELVEYFDKHIIGKKKLVLPDHLTIEKQLYEIGRSMRHSGIVAFVFEDGSGICIETQKVYIHTRKQPKKSTKKPIKK